MTEEMELYLHIPFCVKKCSYCDFLSKSADKETQHAYALAMCEELKFMGRQWRKKPKKIRSVFIGGGTPSWLDTQDMDHILHTLREEFLTVSQELFGSDSHKKARKRKSAGEKEKNLEPEITIECNPGTVTGEKLELYQKYGVNRLSIGLQSADEGELRLLGRIHTFSQFLRTVEMARELRFANINVDVMAGLPYQTWEKLKSTLEKVTHLSPEHISLYNLIVEEGTAFYEKYAQDVKRRECGEATEYLPDEDMELELLERAKILLEQHGYLQYEISNFAQKGKECIHNVGYWRRVPYIGFGIGAASLVEERRCANVTDRDEYIKRCGRLADIRTVEAEETLEEVDFRKRQYQYDSPLWENCEALSRQDAMAEFMFLGLRMKEGVSEAEFERVFGQRMDAVYGLPLDILSRRGLLVRREGRICLTSRGVDISNVVLAEFLL